MQCMGRHPQVTDPTNPIRIVDSIAQEQKNLGAYHKRLLETYFPDGTTAQWKRHLGKDIQLP